MERTLVAIAATGVGLLLLLPGCQKDLATREVASTQTPAAAPDSVADNVAEPGDDAEAVDRGPAKGGAQVWSENCMRCHNYRRPSEHSDRHWEIIAHHMRVRGNLTAEEHRQILAFLKAAN
jgi:cytochrome c1